MVFDFWQISGLQIKSIRAIHLNLTFIDAIQCKSCKIFLNYRNVFNFEMAETSSENIRIKSSDGHVFHILIPFHRSDFSVLVD